MLKEAQIPFFLWLPAAMLFHFTTGTASVQAAKVIAERADILAFSRAVRSDVRESLLMTVEFAPGQGIEEAEPEKPAEDTSGEPDPDAEQETPEIEKIKPAVPTVQNPPLSSPTKVPSLPPQPKAPEPEKVAVAPPPAPKPPEEKKAEPEPEKKEPEKKPEEAAKKDEPQRLELPKPDGRIAVINDPTLQKDQPDNPNAQRIADHANHVKEESMARFRSYDQNSPKPTGGGAPTPLPIQEPGNGTDEQRGFSNEVEGTGDPKPGSEKGPDDPPSEPIARNQQGQNEPVAGREGIKAVDGVEGRAEQTGPQAETITSDGAGNWSISADADPKQKAQKGRKGRKAVAGRAAVAGLPAGALPQQYSINAFGLIDALGKQHLRQEQEKARNTRLTRHRGSFKANEFQKYRAAIENYDPSVKPGNQTSLNAARVPFAAYINTMHNRIHPIFADGFLGSLGKLDADDKLNNPKLATHMELVLDGESGNVVRAGIVRGSGVTAFDVAALSSAKSAGPFGKAPDMIVSPDGKVYVHWEFYRDPYFACTSKFARPYLIKGSGSEDEPATPGPRPAPSGKEDRTAQGGPLRPTKQ